jgi:thermostable 8-oxoguanine DNA glycosylase
MYKKLPKILYLHPHTKGWSIPGYSHDGILLFTSKEKAQRYTYTDAHVHGEPTNVTSVVIKELITTDLPALLTSLVVEGPHFGKYKTVVFNLTNDNKYDGIYNVDELLKLLKDGDTFCSAEGNYEKEHFEKLIDLYDYQSDLTETLDAYKNDFTQAIINEIVLWKVNRYVNTDTALDWLKKLNGFKYDNEIEEKELREFLKLVLTEVRGVRLAMASTFLRFRNPNVYQIIDERMFRVVMRKENPRKKLSSYTTVDSQIDLYIAYLKKLKAICEEMNIRFQQSDRILYQFDIIKNGDFN